MKMRIKIATAAVVTFAALLTAYLFLSGSDNRYGADPMPAAYNEANQATVLSDVPPVDDLVEPLRQRLLQNPDDVDGWVLLGRSYQFLQREQEAAAAFARARSLGWQGDAGDGVTSHATVERSVVEGVRRALDAANDRPLESGAVPIAQP